MGYLAGLDRQELLASIQRPGEEEQEGQGEGEGEGEGEGGREGDKQNTAKAIWSAMDGLVMHCHGTITTRAGVFMRMEAVRTEKAQTKYQPLKPYMSAKALGNSSLL